MRLIQKHLFFSVLLPFFLSATVFAGNTGKLTGKVIDAETGEALVGCNIIIEGTYQGAATDADGRYIVLNIQPGEYRVRAQMIGYRTKIVEKVRISTDLTTTQDFELTSTSLEGEEVVVTAEQRMVIKDQTSSASRMQAEEIEQLPITEINEALEMQAGYVDGSMRGGRKGEITYLVDGIPITDQYDRTAVVDVNKNMVQELQVISGAFNAEYGKVMSGVVNITTKSGSNNFGGSVETYFGDHLSTHNEIFDHIGSFNPASIRNFEVSLRGPIVKDRLFYYINARDIYFGGWLEGKRRYKPIAVAFQDTAGHTVLFDSTRMMGDQSWQPMNWNHKTYLQGQLNYRISDVLSLQYKMFYDDKVHQDYNREYQYNPDGIREHHTLGQTQMLKFQHTLSDRTFYTISLSQYSRDYEGYLSPKRSPTDTSTYVHPYYRTTYPYQFHIGGTENDHEYRDSRTRLAKMDFTSQVTRRHQVKTGVEFRQHDIQWREFTIRPAPGETYVDFSTGQEFPTSFDPYIQPTVLHDSTIYSSSYHHRPHEFALYVQDKMEFTELIVNAGVRVDYFEPDGVILSDPSDPEIYDPIKPSNRYHDLNDNGVRDEGEPRVTLEERREYWYENASPKWQVSPRIGISFPISNQGVFHFSYGHFFQIPNFTYLYQNPEFELGSGTGNQGVIGNADLKPEQTIKGEIGVQQQLTDNFSVDVTAYFKDIRNLTGTRAAEIEVFGGAATYSKLINSDFGVVKGITVTLNQRNPSGVYANLDYTYQVAKGTASDPEAFRNALTGGADPEIQLNPLDWDQRHTINTSLGLNTDLYGVSFIGQYGSGLPYTPRRSKDITSLLTNADKKPATFTVDMRGYYKINLFGLQSEVFLRVLNLFDRLNEVGVYDDTGRAGFTTDEERIEALNIRTPVNSVHEYFIDPTHYSEPRRIEFGLRIDI